ncbi:MAG: twin-arginine translocase TatA/TatE family subunit [Campylobacterales bacterium]
MGSFSVSHWVVVLLVIILLFGAKKIPELARGLGSGIKEFKKGMSESEDKITQNPQSQQTTTQAQNDTTTTPKA